MSILNSDAENFGSYANTAVFTLDFVGLGLPILLFREFSSLLAKASNFASVCIPV